MFKKLIWNGIESPKIKEFLIRPFSKTIVLKSSLSITFWVIILELKIAMLFWIFTLSKPKKVWVVLVKKLDKSEEDFLICTVAKVSYVGLVYLRYKKPHIINTKDEKRNIFSRHRRCI